MEPGLNSVFRSYLEAAVGKENADAAFAAFDGAPSVSVRFNPFKCGSPGEEEVSARFCTCTRKTEWCGEGFLLEDRPVFTLDPFMHCGAYYVQDSSSMFVGAVFRRLAGLVPENGGRPVRVLDLCAAPGGKTTDLAASLRKIYGDGFILVANEVIRQRVGVLANNVALWGDPNVAVTSCDPSRFAAMPGWFDVILADVPCSGEGMFRKDAVAVAQWSESNVAACAARQKRIVADVWPALADGGVLIYSTCTFNRYENDGNAEWAASELGGELLFSDSGLGLENYPGILKTEYGFSLVPGLVAGEGQYCSALRKCGRERAVPAVAQGVRETAGKIPDTIGKRAGEMLKDGAVLMMKRDSLKAVPAAAAADFSVVERVLSPVMSGCLVGTVKGKDLVPSGDLALSYMFDAEVFPRADFDLEHALEYLHHDPVALRDFPAGFVTACYGGLPLGFLKNIGGRCNNLHPVERRIRMNIK